MYVITAGCIMSCFRDASLYFAYVTTLNTQSSRMLTPEFVVCSSTGCCMCVRAMASFSVGISVHIHSPVDTYNFVIKTNTRTIFSEWVVHCTEQLFSKTEIVNYVSVARFWWYLISWTCWPNVWRSIPCWRLVPSVTKILDKLQSFTATCFRLCLGSHH